MKKIAKYVSALVLCLIAGVVLTACGKTKITSAYIKSGTIATTIVKNEQLDTSNAVAVIEYSNDTVKEVGSNDLTFGTIDTSTVGTKDLKVTYDGFNFTVKIKVVATEADVSVVTSFSSDLLTEFKANSGEKINEREEFAIKNKVQLVGDDNALDFRINAKGVDGNGNLVHLWLCQPYSHRGFVAGVGQPNDSRRREDCRERPERDPKLWGGTCQDWIRGFTVDYWPATNGKAFEI